MLRICKENIYTFYSQRNNILLFIYLFCSIHYMFRPQVGHLQVLQVSHILLPNCNANIPIFINGSYKLVSIQFTINNKVLLR
jgi:hypothetical protein